MRQSTREAVVAGAGLLFALAAAAVLAPRRERPAPEAEVVTGQYGYEFGLSRRTSARLRVTKTFKDPGKIIEAAYLFPLFMDPDAVLVVPDYSYGPLGAVRFEAASNAVYPPMPPDRLAEAMKEAVTGDLKERRVRFAAEDVRGGRLNGFRVTTAGTPPLTTTYLVGTKAHYTIFGDKSNPAVQEILATLKETP